MAIRPGVMINVLQETNDVKVEKVTLKPGARTGFHADKMPYTMIACSTGRTVRFDKEGKFLELLYLEPGLHIQRDATFAHDVLNASEDDVVMLKVFYKGRVEAGAKPPRRRRRSASKTGK